LVSEIYNVLVSVSEVFVRPLLSCVFHARTQQILTEIGASHIGVGFGTVFVRSVFAGWLVALIVWLLPGAESARVSIIIIVTYLAGISGFDRIIAGSTATFFLLVRGSISSATYIVQFLQPHVITAHILRLLNTSLKEANWTLNLWC
jgi:formate/nitrite transporter FocA (FNT family)